MHRTHLHPKHAITLLSASQLHQTLSLILFSANNRVIPVPTNCTTTKSSSNHEDHKKKSVRLAVTQAQDTSQEVKTIS